MRACLLAAALSLARGQLFGLSASVQLQRFDASGTATPVGPPVANEDQAQNLAALDNVNGIYYFVGFDPSSPTPRLIGLSLSTGAVVSSVTLPFVEEAFVGVGQLLAWASDLGLAVMTGQTADQTHLIGTVNATSGAWTQVASISRADDDVLGGSAAYIPGEQTFIFNLGAQNGTVIDNFAVDLKTGSVRNGTNTQMGNLESMSYNAADGKVYGLGLHIDGNAWNRSIAVMDPATLEITEIGQVPGFGIESGGIGTVDVAGNSLWWIGMQSPYTPNAPFFLIQTSLQDASVKSSAQICDSDPTCPWSLQYRG
jgi:hypothetical protein